MSNSTEFSLQPTSPNPAPSWKAPPNFRTTVDLVSSCVLTLVVCVWTAIHLNIQPYNERRRRGGFAPYLWRRMWWMLMGLLAPELVLYTAWSQYIQARQVTLMLKEIDEASRQHVPLDNTTRGNEAQNNGAQERNDVDGDYQNDLELAQQSFGLSLLPDGDGLTTPSKLSWYTRLGNLISPDELERGYYAVMGGFEVVVGKEKNRGDILQTVTPCGTILLARLGLLPSLSIEGINDKSKADLLTKTLVCTQACLMLVQAVARKVNELPITLLELNTIMHVVCALCMYLLWLKKPQDVRTPTIIYDMDKRMPLGTLLSIKGVKKEQPDAESRIVRWTDEMFELGERSTNMYGERVTRWVQQWHEDEVPSTVPRKIYVDSLLICRGDGTDTYISFQENTFLTHEKAQLLIDYCIGKIPTFGRSKLSWEEFCEEAPGNGYTEMASNFELEGSINSTGSRFAGVTAAVLFPAIYGGVHLTPWNAHFPTYLERFLWRTSGILIATSTAFVWCIVMAIDSQPTHLVFETLTRVPSAVGAPFRAFKLVLELGPGKFRSCKGLICYPPLALIALLVWAVMALGVILLLCGWLLYPSARLYILVEAFASLRSLPQGAYDTVVWTDIWPHLS